jgi:uncharacterized protein (DUF362 family)
VTESEQNNITRRDFIRRSAKAGASLAIAGAASYWLYDAAGPQVITIEEGTEALPDFSIPHSEGKTISIVKGADRIEAVNKAIDLLGGIKRFVKPGEKVLIKPNVAFASPPILGATANPQLVAEVVRLCYRRGKAKQVIVTDNPINDPESCFRLSGIGKAASEAGAKILLPRDSYFRTVSLSGGRLIKNWPVYAVPFKNVDKLIGIAPVKDHDRSGASMTMKNWYGLLGGRRNIFHQDINTIIAELAMMVKATLVILDGTQVMMTNGPTGGAASDLQRKDTMIAGCNAVAADAYGCSLLNLTVNDLPYLDKARKGGAGTTDLESLKPIFASLS